MPRRHIIIAVGLGLAALAAVPFQVFAATLYFSPATQTVSVGQIFNVVVEASSMDQAMNAASGDISFPSDKLRVLSVTNSRSAMTLWVQNPSFSNASTGGDINFAGIVLNPGFTGTGANVFTIRFQAVAVGQAKLRFSTGAVLANDGKGTNILTSMDSASFTITPARAVGSSTPSSSAPSSLPAVSSSEPTVSSSVQASTAPVSTGNAIGWLGPMLSLLFSWGLIIISILILLALIIALVYYIIYRLRRFRLSLTSDLEHERKELEHERRELEGKIRHAERESEDGNSTDHYTLDLRKPGGHK